MAKTYYFFEDGSNLKNSKILDSDYGKSKKISNMDFKNLFFVCTTIEKNVYKWDVDEDSYFSSAERIRYRARKIYREDVAPSSVLNRLSNVDFNNFLRNS